MICLTFDTDYMTDAAMRQFLATYPLPGCATFFAHDDLPSLFASGHEFGPHPFISDLGRWDADIDRLAALLPRRPVGTRAHSCVFSHMIGIGLHEKGYRYVSQAQQLFDPRPRPFRHPWGVWELPIYYMDNMDFWMPKNWPDIGHQPFASSVIEQALSGDGLYVFDIHPLHVALNTRSHEDYVGVKDEIVKAGRSPFDLRFPGRGAGAFFEELCDRMRSREIRSYSCAEALAGLGCA